MSVPGPGADNDAMGGRFYLVAPARTAAETLLIRLTAVCAVAVPALVGATVKLRLDALGRPTLSWGEGVIAMLPIVVSAGAGWVLLALPFRYWLRRWGADPARRAAGEWAWAGALLGGSAGLAFTLYALLQVAANAVMVAVLAPWWLWWWTLGGGCAGAALGLGLRGLLRGRDRSLRPG
jgi:hypothetical protein